MKRAYYNDSDRHMCAWLDELIARGLLPDGDVDNRDIADIAPGDLERYGQCHFFAGIGGWPLALRYAGVPDHAAIWTGSPPCQPLSRVGRQQGHVDQRHCWPAFQRLIAERQPATVFGEQVADADGREWLAGVRADLEHMGYAVGAADLPAASEGAPHKRQRIFFVGHAIGARSQERLCRPDALPDTGGRPEARRSARLPSRHGHWRHWHYYDCAHLTDGSSRRIEPGTFPLADGIPQRVVRLRGYGNAIVPQVAAAFVIAAMEARAGTLNRREVR